MKLCKSKVIYCQTETEDNFMRGVFKKTCRFRRFHKFKKSTFLQNIPKKKLIFFCCCCMCKLFCSFFAYSFSVGRIHKRPGNAVFSTAISYYSKWSKERAVASQTKSNQPLVFVSFTLTKQKSCFYRVSQQVCAKSLPFLS